MGKKSRLKREQREAGKSGQVVKKVSQVSPLTTQLQKNWDLERWEAYISLFQRNFSSLPASTIFTLRYNKSLRNLLAVSLFQRKDLDTAKSIVRLVLKYSFELCPEYEVETIRCCLVVNAALVYRRTGILLDVETPQTKLFASFLENLKAGAAGTTVKKPVFPPKGERLAAKFVRQFGKLGPDATATAYAALNKTATELCTAFPGDPLFQELKCFTAALHRLRNRRSPIHTDRDAIREIWLKAMPAEERPDDICYLAPLWWKLLASARELFGEGWCPGFVLDISRYAYLLPARTLAQYLAFQNAGEELAKKSSPSIPDVVQKTLVRYDTYFSVRERTYLGLLLILLDRQGLGKEDEDEVFGGPRKDEKEYIFISSLKAWLELNPTSKPWKELKDFFYDLLEDIDELAAQSKDVIRKMLPNLPYVMAARAALQMDMQIPKADKPVQLTEAEIKDYKTLILDKFLTEENGPFPAARFSELLQGLSPVSRQQLCTDLCSSVVDDFIKSYTNNRRPPLPSFAQHMFERLGMNVPDFMRDSFDDDEKDNIQNSYTTLMVDGIREILLAEIPDTDPRKRFMALYGDEEGTLSSDPAVRAAFLNTDDTIFTKNFLNISRWLFSLKGMDVDFWKKFFKRFGKKMYLVENCDDLVEVIEKIPDRTLRIECSRVVVDEWKSRKPISKTLRQCIDRLKKVPVKR